MFPLTVRHCYTKLIQITQCRQIRRGFSSDANPGAFSHMLSWGIKCITSVPKDTAWYDETTPPQKKSLPARSGSQNKNFKSRKSNEDWKEAKKKSNLVLHTNISKPHCPSDPLLFVPHQKPTYCLPFSVGEMIDARPTQACVKSKGIKHTEGCFTYNNANYISCKLSKKLISNNSNLTELFQGALVARFVFFLVLQ